jgi:hypothetical protein
MLSVLITMRWLTNRINGEPGFAWLENMRAYSRMGDEPDYKDKRAEGGNPCLEQVRSHRIAAMLPTVGGCLVLDSRAQGRWVLGVVDVSRSHKYCIDCPQTLESYELCCLVETFPNNHDSVDDFLATLEAAYLYAKTVTLGMNRWCQVQWMASLWRHRTAVAVVMP